MEAGGITTTSGYRDPSHKLSRANPNSAHTKALAFDSRAHTPEEADATMAKIRARMTARGLVEGRDYNILDEVRRPSGHATAKHIHTAMTPEGMKRYQEARVAESSRVAAAAAANAEQPRADASQSPVLDLPRGSKNTLLDLPLPPNRSGTGGAERNELDRAALDRAALNDAMKVRADGSVKVKVAESAANSNEQKDKLFADTPMQRQEAGQLTNIGPNAHESAKQYMASR
jgi:hypothetical protein